MTFPAKLVPVEGEIRDVTVAAAQKLADLIGAKFVEVVHTPAGVLIVDESGMINGRPRNARATEMYGHEYIAGDVLLFTRADFEAYDRSLA